jgi:hypothetical protein
MREGIPEKRLASATSAIDKEELSFRLSILLSSHSRFQNLIMSKSLAFIQLSHCLISLLHFHLRIIGSLLSNQTVSHHLIPVTSHLRHVLKVRQRIAILAQDLINQVESKIIDLIISGIWHPMPCLKTMSQVITYAIFELVPELIWSRGFTVGKDGHK